MENVLVLTNAFLLMVLSVNNELTYMYYFLVKMFMEISKISCFKISVACGRIFHGMKDKSCAIFIFTITLFYL